MEPISDPFEFEHVLELLDLAVAELPLSQDVLEYRLNLLIDDALSDLKREHGTQLTTNEEAAAEWLIALRHARRRLKANRTLTTHALAPQSITRAVWLASPTVTPQLLRLFAVNASATVGGHVPTLREDGTGAFSLLGRPVVISEKMHRLGDVGDLAFVDLSQYLIAIRLAAAIEKSQHYGWQRDTTSFRIKIRVDARPKWSQAVTPVRGDTLSWAVTLAERA